MIGAIASRFAASSRGRAAVLVAALGAAGLLALSPGSLAPVAARAALAGAAVAAVAAVVRRRSRPPGAAPPLEVVAREPLAGGPGLAVVRAGSRRLLVGFGRDGVRLVADLGPAAEGQA